MPKGGKSSGGSRGGGKGGGGKGGGGKKGPPNAPSKTAKKSGKGRGNNPPQKRK